MRRNTKVLTNPPTTAFAGTTPSIKISGLQQWRVAWVGFSYDNQGGAVAESCVLNVRVNGVLNYSVQCPAMATGTLGEGEFGVGLTDYQDLAAGTTVPFCKASLPPIVFDGEGETINGEIEIVGRGAVTTRINTLVLDRVISNSGRGD